MSRKVATPDPEVEAQLFFVPSLGRQVEAEDLADLETKLNEEEEGDANK